MEELSPQEKARILEERRAKFAKLGIPNAGQINQNSLVLNENTGQMSMHQKMQAIKSGKFRNEFKQIMTADPSNAPGAFKEIPVTKKRINRPGQPAGSQASSNEYKVPLEEFKGSDPTGELGLIANMFGEGGGRNGGGGYDVDLSSYGNPHPGGEINADSVLNRMPAFDHRDALRKARQKNADDSFLQFAQKNSSMPKENLVYNEAGELVEAPVRNTPTTQMDMHAINEMMQSMSQIIAENAVKAAMSLVEKQNKNKGSFEWYDKSRNIIILDGKVFLIKEVSIVNKKS